MGGKPKPGWHLVIDVGGANGTLCEGLVFEFGDAECEYNSKPYFGYSSITCEDCKRIYQGWKSFINEKPKK